MKWKEYQEKAMATCSPMTDRLITAQEQNIIHMILGMITEVAELADNFKKHFAYGKEFDIVNVEEEIGDLFWYVGNICTFLNIDIEKIMIKNILKLQKRFPDKFTQFSALNRDLDAERKILEG